MSVEEDEGVEETYSEGATEESVSEIINANCTMPKRDGTMYAWERAELNQAKGRYDKAVDEVK